MKLPPRAALCFCAAIAGILLSLPKTRAAEPQSQPLNFENDIVPILSKFGCNASG